MSNFIGTIKHIRPDARWGLLEDEQQQTYLFSEGRFTGVGFDDLVVGQVVEFDGFTKENKGYITRIQTHNPAPTQNNTFRQPERVQSVVSHLNLEKHCGFIARLSPQESKDFYFNEKDVGSTPLAQFQVGCLVEFDIWEQDGKRYAKNIAIIAQAPPQTQHQKDVDITHFTQEIVQVLRQQIKQVSHSPFLFEDYAAFLLKLLGVPDVHPVPRTNAGGMFDGLFKLQGVEIIYDCTLHTEFEHFKKEQIDNYINKIKQSSITVNSRTVSLNATATKQIWVITNGARSRILQCVDDIYVKEICILDLLNILEKRLNQSYTSLELASRLRELGQEHF